MDIAKDIESNPMYKLIKDSSVDHVVEMAHSPSSEFYTVSHTLYKYYAHVYQCLSAPILHSNPQG